MFVPKILKNKIFSILIMENSKIDQTKFFGNTQKAYDAEILEELLVKSSKDNDSSFKEAKEYFLTYFAQSDGDYYYKYEPSEDENDTYGSIINRDTLQNVFKKFSKDYTYYCNTDKKSKKFNLKSWFENDYKETFKINADPRTSRFYTSEKTGKKFINISKGFLHKNIKPYASYSEDIQNKVQRVISHIEKIWNSGKKTQSEFCLNFLAHALTGHKMNVALFLKSGEGTGKSLIVDFIISHVIGNDLGVSTPRAQQIMKFNSVLLGKIFLCLEELPTSNKNEWHSISDYLKDLITGSKIEIEKKYADAIQTINLMSLILLTNNENTIKFGKDIRRYMMCDVSHDRVGDGAYFDSFVQCLTREVGEAFFMWLLERYEATKNFNPSECPMTDAKMEMKENNSTPILKYVKREFVANHLGLIDPAQKHQMIKLSTLKDNINREFSSVMTTQKFHLALKTDISIVKVIPYGKNKELFIEPINHETLLNWFIKKGFWNETFDEYTDVSKPQPAQSSSTKNISALEKRIAELEQRLSKFEPIDLMTEVDEPIITIQEPTPVEPIIEKDIMDEENEPQERPIEELVIQPKKILKIKKVKKEQSFKEQVKNNEEGDGVLDLNEVGITITF